MSSTAITTIIKMVEFLPNGMQEKVVEHVREYIAELEDGRQWDESFAQTQDSLIAAAQQAKQAIAAGQSTPMNYGRL
jgi:hypothetical protein